MMMIGIGLVMCDDDAELTMTWYGRPPVAVTMTDRYT